MAGERPHAAEQLRRVQAVTDAALAHLSLDLLLDELLVRVRELLGGDTAAVLLLDEERQELVAEAAKGLEEEVERGVRVPVGRGFAGRVAATGRPIILTEVTDRTVFNPLLIEKGIRSMLGVPMIVDGRVIGVLHVGMLKEHTFSDDDVELLQLVADRAALAVEVRRGEAERLTVQTLQRSLIPDRFPVVAGVEIAARYAPAVGVVGGDWYDVFTLPSGQLFLAVGDVAGRGLAAAVAMARLRDAVRAVALADANPGRAMGMVNDVAMHFDRGVLATLLLAVMAEDGEVTFASAGHLPPLVLDATGRAFFVEGEAEPPIGVAPRARFRDRAIKLEPGCSLVLYTDGLVERRDRPLDEGLEKLRRTMEEGGWTSIDALASRVLGEDGRGEQEDDQAVVVLHLPAEGMGSTFHLTIAARREELGRLRRVMRRWLNAAGADEQERNDILVAVGEAAANSIEHGYAPGRGSVDIDGAVRDGDVEVTIADRGRWREPLPSGYGRGILLMRGVMDDVAVDTGNTGTTVRMRRRLISGGPRGRE